ncbi:hypothetical protein NP233_g1757 [Leucocoprinus birnbaumii]|uniref:Uncharacterized protein n=1 Tax=Leucocoprinus birnbaumii TaxID=56174 RepID=A0AAD5W1Z4_9AGAR|nr:hypothetical protein NP233_g1757 [Leucocoprinus birnbaumii]
MVSVTLRSNIILALALVSLSSALPTFEHEGSLSQKRASENFDALAARKFNPLSFIPKLVNNIFGSGSDNNAQPAQPVTTMIQQPMDHLMIPRTLLDAISGGSEPIKDVSDGHYRRELSADEVDMLLRREPFSEHSAIEDGLGAIGGFDGGAIAEREAGADEPDIILPRDPKLSSSHAIEDGLGAIRSFLGRGVVERDVSVEETDNLMARSLWGTIAKDGLKIGEKVVGDVLPSIDGSFFQRDMDSEETKNLLARSLKDFLRKHSVKIGYGSGNNSFFRRDDGLDEVGTLEAREPWGISDTMKMHLSDQV